MTPRIEGEPGCRLVYLNDSFVTWKERLGDFDACWDVQNVDDAKLDLASVIAQAGGNNSGVEPSDVRRLVFRLWPKLESAITPLAIARRRKIANIAAHTATTQVEPQNWLAIVAIRVALKSLPIRRKPCPNPIKVASTRSSTFWIAFSVNRCRSNGASGSSTATSGPSITMAPTITGSH
jgi:hypothetical protein